jgi:hypothetical protein
MRYKLSFLLAFLAFSLLHAQTDSTRTAPEGDPASEQESAATEEDYNLPTDPPKVFQTIFTRGFLLGATSLDSVPLNGVGSGSYSIHGGIKINLARNIVGIRISPGVAWNRLAYSQNDLKTFPTINDSLALTPERERHLLFYADLPISFYVNLSRDEDGDSKLFLEAGGYVSYLLGASYKRKSPDGNDLTVIYLERNLQRLDEEWQALRYGVFGRIGYKWASLYFGFRLSPLLDDFTNQGRQPNGSAAYQNPTIPPMELGLSLLL